MFLILVKSEVTPDFICFPPSPLCCRWWRITTARRITRTHAWCQSLYIVSRPCCAEHTSSVRTGSCCWKSPTSRACSVCAPASRTPWLLSGGGSWSPSPTFEKVKHSCQYSISKWLLLCSVEKVKIASDNNIFPLCNAGLHFNLLCHQLANFTERSI